MLAEEFSSQVDDIVTERIISLCGILKERTDTGGLPLIERL